MARSQRSRTPAGRERRKESRVTRLERLIRDRDFLTAYSVAAKAIQRGAELPLPILEQLVRSYPGVTHRVDQAETVRKDLLVIAGEVGRRTSVRTRRSLKRSIEGQPNELTSHVIAAIKTGRDTAPQVAN